MDLFKLGKDKDTGKILEITEVEGGLSCNCICPNCGKDLVAAQGAKTEWYFRHHESTDCDAGPEIGLQELTKEVLASNSRIKLPSFGVIKYENVEEAKKPGFLSFSPDFLVKSEGDYLYVKIKINHEKSPDDEGYKELGYNSIEIDLTDYVFTSKEEFRKDLLNEVSNKDIIFWKDEIPDMSKKIMVIPAIIGLLGAGVALGALVFSGRKQNRRVLTSSKNKKSPKQLIQHYDRILDKLSKII